MRGWSTEKTHSALLPQTIPLPTKTVTGPLKRSRSIVAVIARSPAVGNDCRQHGIHEVTGSIPVWSTISNLLISNN
jgi:hypothetical protein